jgi:hypothetical protein
VYNMPKASLCACSFSSFLRNSFKNIVFLYILRKK